jgi:hypothetical protein
MRIGQGDIPGSVGQGASQLAQERSLSATCGEPAPAALPATEQHLHLHGHTASLLDPSGGAQLTAGAQAGGPIAQSEIGEHDPPMRGQRP